MISRDDNEVKGKKTDSSSGIEGETNPLMKLSSIITISENTNIEENMKPSKVKNLRQKIVKPYEREFLNKLFL